jgi:hypothetical protein
MWGLRTTRYFELERARGGVEGVRVRVRVRVRVKGRGCEGEVEGEGVSTVSIA